MGWALSLMTGAFIWRKIFDDTEETHKEKGHAYDDRGRDYSDGSYKSLKVY